MSKGIDVSLDELIHKNRQQKAFGFKKYVQPRYKNFDNNYGENQFHKPYNYSGSRTQDRGFRPRRHIVFRRRGNFTGQYEGNHSRIQEREPEYKDYEEEKSYESQEQVDREGNYHSNQNRSKVSDRRKTSDEGGRRSRSPELKSKTRLLISNLPKSINNKQLFDLFSEYGKLTRCGIHWDILGNSLGTADIEFEDPEHAKKAVKDIDNGEVEGHVLSVDFALTKNIKPDLNERIKKIRLKEKEESRYSNNSRRSNY